MRLFRLTSILRRKSFGSRWKYATGIVLSMQDSATRVIPAPEAAILMAAGMLFVSHIVLGVN